MNKFFRFNFTKDTTVAFGVGALWDVIVSSEAGEEIKNLESFIIALVILVLSVGWIFISKKRLSGQAR